MATRPLSRKAATSLALSALFVGLISTPAAVFAFPVGIASVALGLLALGDVHLEEGRLRGRWLAVSALIIQGAFFWIAFSWAPCSPVVKASRRAKCRSRLKDLAEAMHVYRDGHGTLPPHALYGASGKPLLSWRVLLLPSLGQTELFEEFRLDEPWDSPHNARLLARRPQAYAAPGPWPGDGAQGTFFQVFVGKGAAFEGRKGMRLLEDFPDGTSNTVLIAEAGDPVPWTKPEDLPYAPDQPLPKVGGLRLRDRFGVALADGSARLVPTTVGETDLRAAITRNGDEKFTLDW